MGGCPWVSGCQSLGRNCLSVDGDPGSFDRAKNPILEGGQFLAFIHLYRRLHRQGPAELDMVQFFRVTPPSVHGMVAKLEHLGLVTREPGVPRSVRAAIPEGEIPALEDVEGPPW
jgi:hypothetical protein